MSSWMKTLQSGANKVGRAPAQQSNVAPGTRRRRWRRGDGLLGGAQAAYQSLPRPPTMSSWNMRATPTTSARRVCDANIMRTGNEAAKLKLAAEISLLKGDIKSLKEAEGHLLRHTLPRRRERRECLAREAARQDPREGIESAEDRQGLNKLKAPKEPLRLLIAPVACRLPRCRRRRRP